MAPRKNNGNSQNAVNGAGSHAAYQHGAYPPPPPQHGTATSTTPRQPPQHKFDPAEVHRAEIERRTALGETCEQIASALRAQGVDITNKTISRRRVEWGLRKRPYSKLLGTKATVPRPKKTSGTKSADTNARKLEIEQRTLAGQSAGEIAEALQQGGYVLKKGASTVLRLQTQWGFIEPDVDRARGRKRKRGGGGGDGGGGEGVAPKIRKKDLPRLLREQEREANKMQQMQAQTLHYPTNCSFGPKRRVGALGVGLAEVGGGDDDEDENGRGGDDGAPPACAENSIMPDLDTFTPDTPAPLLPYPDHPPPPVPHPPHHHHHQANVVSNGNNVSLAAEIMSVEFLVDLATSTLSAAENLKAMLQASQARQPVLGSTTGLPPSAEDLSTARRKVREAAAVMHDLAVEPGRE